jgi:hypothetical protein
MHCRYLEMLRDGRARPRISRAMDTPSRKPLAKWEKLPDVQSRTAMPNAKTNEPAAVNKLLLRQIMVPPSYRAL